MPERRLGIDFDSSWARRYPVRLARAAFTDFAASPVVRLLATPTVHGRDQLDRTAGPVILAANHASHLDTPLLISTLPVHLRHHLVVAAAADYFFDRTWKAMLWSLELNAIPMERARVNRRSAELAAELLEQGWSLLIFPEGGRSPDGWLQELRGGAAYLSQRTQAPIFPVYISGTREILAKGSRRLRRSKVTITFGTPLSSSVSHAADHTAGPAKASEPVRPALSSRRLGAELEKAIATLADEAGSDWFQARLRAARSMTPDPKGPSASPWRRSWELGQTGAPGSAHARWPESYFSRTNRKGPRSRP